MDRGQTKPKTNGNRFTSMCTKYWNVKSRVCEGGYLTFILNAF